MPTLIDNELCVFFINASVRSSLSSRTKSILIKDFWLHELGSEVHALDSATHVVDRLVGNIDDVLDALPHHLSRFREVFVNLPMRCIPNLPRLLHSVANTFVDVGFNELPRLGSFVPCQSHRVIADLDEMLFKKRAGRCNLWRYELPGVRCLVLD